MSEMSMLNVLLLLNLALFIAFVIGLYNPKLVLRGGSRTRLKSSGIYLGLFIASGLTIGALGQPPAPHEVAVTSTAKPKIQAIPKQEVKLTPSPTPKATPTPTEPVEIEPPKEETNTTTHFDGSYTKDTIETRTFQNPDKSIYLLIKKTEKNVERGKITTKIETQIQHENSPSRTTEVVVTTQTDQGTQIETEKIAENGVIDKQQASNDNIPQEVWDSFKIAEQTPQESEDVSQDSASIPTGAKCEDFITQADAQAALPANPQLDKNGDGTACDSLTNGTGGSYVHQRSSGSYHHTGRRRKR